MKRTALRFFAAAVMFCALSVSVCADEAEFKRFFAELWRYEYSGASNYAGIERFSGVSKAPAFAAAGTVWSFERGAGRIIGLYMEEYADIFDVPPLDENTGGAEDVAGHSADGVLQAETPEELSEMQKERVQKAALLPPPEHHFTDTEGRLRFHSFEDENLSLQKTADGYIAARSSDKNAIRMFYDADFRLSKREFWDLNNGLETSRAVKTENYGYAGGSKPVSAVIVEPKSRTEISYDETGRIILSNVFTIDREDDENSADAENEDAAGGDTELEDFILKSMTRFSYGKGGKLTERYAESYDYRYGRRSGIQTQREVYEHKSDDGEPDYYFYENGALRIKRIYGGVDTYTAYMYFDGGYSSETMYENGKRVRDLFFFHDKLVRSRNYE